MRKAATARRSDDDEAGGGGHVDLAIRGILVKTKCGIFRINTYGKPFRSGK